METLELIKVLRQADRLGQLALELELFAAGQGEAGQGMGIVAEETRRLARFCERQANTGGRPGTREQPDPGVLPEWPEALEQLLLLSLNAELELRGLEKAAANKTGTAAGAILLAELRDAGSRLAELVCPDDRNPLRVMSLSEPAERHPVLSGSVRLLFAACAGTAFAEPLENVKEIFRFSGAAVERDGGTGTYIRLRDRRLPLISGLTGVAAGAAFPAGGRHQALVIRCASGAFLAVAVDPLAANCIQEVPIGRSCRLPDTHCEPDKNGRQAEGRGDTEARTSPSCPCRDRWPGSDGLDLCFPDWARLV